MIKIDFEMKDAAGVYTYRDALHLADDHYFTEDEIESMKQARFNKWLSIITTPTATVEELVVSIDG